MARARQRERERETDRQTDRQTDRERERETESACAHARVFVSLVLAFQRVPEESVFWMQQSRYAPKLPRGQKELGPAAAFAAPFGDVPSACSGHRQTLPREHVAGCQNSGAC